MRDDEARKRFEREAKAAARLDHPNICTVYEIDEAEGRTFIVMAFLEGRPLSDRIKEGPLKLTEALSVAAQMAEGLEAAHEKGITHRDIKPDNLMLMKGSRGLVKVMDFGLAQLAGGSKFTREGTTLGTMSYMSPEQAAGAETDSRTDIWSLGVVLYEMVAGQPPFRGDYEQVVVYSIINEPPEPLTAVRTGVPKELERIANKCLAKEAASRYQGVSELLVDLRELQKEQQVEGATRARSAPTPAPAPQSHRTPWLLAGAAVLVALVVSVGAFLGLFESEKPAAEQPLEAVPLTSYPGREQHPTFSPDGSRVAFAWNGESQDNFDIYVKEIDSDNRHRLTTDSAEDTAPAWSPDGRFITFLRLDPGEDKSKVVIIPSIGGPELIVGESVGDQQYFSNLTPAWTPDSKQLIVVNRNSPDEAMALFLLSIDTGKTNRLTSPGGAWGDIMPAFSPDSTTLAFTRGTGVFSQNVFLLPLNADLSAGGEPRRLTSIGAIITGLSWSADGDAIIFSGGRLESQRLWKIPVSGGNAQQVAAAGAGSSYPAISRQAHRLAYTSQTFDENVWAIRVGDDGSSGALPARLLSSTRTDYVAYYSPDGKRIVFNSDRTGTSGIWLSDADGSNPEPLFIDPEGAFSGSARWSPDGRHLAFDSYHDRNFDIFVISASGGEPFRLTSHPTDDQVPSWSSDGKWVYFGSARTGRFEIWKASAGGGEPVQVTTRGGHSALEDPNGEFLYYHKTLDELETALWKIPVDGGEESKVLDSVITRNFAVAQGGIYFMQAPEEDDPERSYSIRFLDFSGGPTQLVTRLPAKAEMTWGLGVSPDGKSILYSQIDDQSSDLMLIEGFR